MLQEAKLRIFTIAWFTSPLKSYKHYHERSLCRKTLISAQSSHCIMVLCESAQRRLSAMEVAADDAQHGFGVIVGQGYFVAIV